MWRENRSILGLIADTFASRLAFIVSVSGLILICAWAGQTVNHSLANLKKDQKVFTDRQMRNGFVSMSDVQRVLLIAQEARNDGQFSAEQKHRFLAAVDFVFVRKGNFRRVLTAGETLASAEAAIESLETIVQISEAAIANDFPDVKRLLSDLLVAAENAREKLVVFLDDMERMQSEVLRDQSAAVVEQRAIVLASLGALTVLAVLALVFLRREVVARRAREKAERDVQFLAYFDQLTHLPNRTQFQQRLERQLTTNAPVALLFVDLDDFKGINDTYGHAAGDAALRHVADLFASHAQISGGFAARLGGDEFALVLPVEEHSLLLSICKDILDVSSSQFSFEGEGLSTSLSIGLSTRTQLGESQPITLDALCRVTDFALYASKTNGRGQFTFYDNELERRFMERRSMVAELPMAIRNGLLEVYLQPQIKLRDCRTYGFEALVRWNRNGIIVPPVEFICVAEESGVVLELDRSVLLSATKTVAAHNDACGTNFSVSVNLSALHFASRRIVGWIEEALTASLLTPQHLTVEITESVEMSDWRKAREIISEIRSLGVRISIDDFGTGYSSLSYLRTTLADELKIDRSLIEQIETSDKARFLLDGVLDIAGNLELDVIVEGIETEAQARIVEEMGAAYAQGYLFGRPLPAEEALKLASSSPENSVRFG